MWAGQQTLHTTFFINDFVDIFKLFISLWRSSSWSLFLIDTQIRKVPNAHWSSIIGILIEHEFLIFFVWTFNEMEIQSWSMRWQIKNKGNAGTILRWSWLFLSSHEWKFQSQIIWISSFLNNRKNTTNKSRWREELLNVYYLIFVDDFYLKICRMKKKIKSMAMNEEVKRERKKFFHGQFSISYLFLCLSCLCYSHSTHCITYKIMPHTNITRIHSWNYVSVSNFNYIVIRNFFSCQCEPTITKWKEGKGKEI